MKKPGLALRLVERVILAVPRRGMRKNAGKKLRAAVGAIDQCIKTRAKLAKYKMPDVLRLYDVSIFCLMYDADLAVLSRDMTCRSDWWESRLYGRMLAMTMLECVEDIPAVLGKKFRNSLAVIVLEFPNNNASRSSAKAFPISVNSMGRNSATCAQLPPRTVIMMPACKRQLLRNWIFAR